MLRTFYELLMLWTQLTLVALMLLLFVAQLKLPLLPLKMTKEFYLLFLLNIDRNVAHVRVCVRVVRFSPADRVLSQSSENERK